MRPLRTCVRLSSSFSFLILIFETQHDIFDWNNRLDAKLNYAASNNKM